MSNINYQINNIVLFPYQFALQHFQAISEETQWNGRVVVHLIWGLLEMSLPVINYIIAIFDALINQRPLDPWPLLPDEFFIEVLTFLSPKDVGRSMRVCKYWRDQIRTAEDFVWNQQAQIAGILSRTTRIENIKQLFTKRHIIFGGRTWIRYIGDPGEIPPLPLNIYEILQSPCPFWPEKTLRETHILVLIPKNVTRIVNGTSVTLPFILNNLKDLLTSEGRDFDGPHFRRSGCISDRVLEELGDTQIEKSYWILITRIPGSMNKSYADQKQLVESHPGYQIPTVLEAAAFVFLFNTHYMRSLFSSRYSSYTRCQEIVDACPTQVGNISLGLLDIHESTRTSRKIGVAGVRKLPSL